MTRAGCGANGAGGRKGVAAVCVLIGVLVARALAAACVGDCSGDGVVTVDEVLQGVSINLGNMPVSVCPVFDRNSDGAVTVDEVLTAVLNALNGCPLATPTQTPSPTATKTSAPPPTATATLTIAPSASPTASPSPTPAVAIPAHPVYRTYPGFPIQLPIGATDPEGAPAHCVAADLPPGAMFDEASATLNWTPAADQLGPFYVPFTCSNAALPPASVDGQLVIKVQPLDACVQPMCDPAAGCQSTPVPLDTSCCAASPPARIAEPVASCPEGRVLFAGRNTDTGFGRLQDCDQVQIRSAGQAGPGIRINIEARCINLGQPVTTSVRLETKDRVLFDRQQSSAQLVVRDDGYGQRMQIALFFTGIVRFPDLEGTEAQLTVRLTDHDFVMIEETQRVILTWNTLTDLPDVDPGSPSP